MGACLNLVDRRILNLAINARNAMPKGGRKRLVVLEIREFKVMVADLSHTEMSEGNSWPHLTGREIERLRQARCLVRRMATLRVLWMQFNLHRSDESNWERSVAVITQVIGPAE
jgi:hypothetical protein